MSMDDPVARALADLANADASRRASEHLEPAVLAAFDRQQAAGSPRGWAAAIRAHRLQAVAVAGAAVLATAVYVSMPERTSMTSRVSERPIADPPVSGVGQAPPAWRASDDIVHSVHVRMPREMLSMFGVPIIEPAAAGTVHVEVLVGNDGIARTIRVVR
jgi:hypothetical protein